MVNTLLGGYVHYGGHGIFGEQRRAVIPIIPAGLFHALDDAELPGGGSRAIAAIGRQRRREELAPGIRADATVHLQVVLPLEIPGGAGGAAAVVAVQGSGV